MQHVLGAGAAGFLHRRPGADGDDSQCVACVVLLRAHAEHAALCGPRQRCFSHHNLMLGLPAIAWSLERLDPTLTRTTCCEGA